MPLAAGMILVLLDQFTTSFRRGPQTDSILWQTQHFRAEQYRLQERYRHPSRLAKESQGVSWRLRRSWHLTASCCPIVRQLSGACGLSKDLLAGSEFPSKLVIKRDMETCWRSVYVFTIYVHAV